MMAELVETEVFDAWKRKRTKTLQAEINRVIDEMRAIADRHAGGEWCTADNMAYQQASMRLMIYTLILCKRYAFDVPHIVFKATYATHVYG